MKHEHPVLEHVLECSIMERRHINECAKKLGKHVVKSKNRDNLKRTKVKRSFSFHVAVIISSPVNMCIQPLHYCPLAAAVSYFRCFSLHCSVQSWTSWDARSFFSHQHLSPHYFLKAYVWEDALNKQTWMSQLAKVYYSW